MYEKKTTKVRPKKNFMQQQQKFPFPQFTCFTVCTILTSFRLYSLSAWE